MSKKTTIASTKFPDLRCGKADYELFVDVEYTSYFSITGRLYQDGKMEACGCLHDHIKEHCPQYAYLIKWHMCSIRGPMYYVENTIYLAGDRDHWGLRAGEFRQHTSRGRDQNGGVEGVLNWKLELPEGLRRDVYAAECPPPVTLTWQPNGITGVGKKRELDAARQVAVWPDATDEELMQEPEALKAALLARLPKLMEEFRKDMASIGFTFTDKKEE